MRNAPLSGPTTSLLIKRKARLHYFKAKSDYVDKPLTKQAIGGALDILQKNTQGWMILEPYGGVMNEISSSAIAFPHRGRNLMGIQYQAVWPNEDGSPDQALIAWLDGLYTYMAPYVSYFPSRAAYVNYIDLQLGDGVAAGKHYFGPNFAKLVQIKGRIDPTNIFNQPQSIPTSL